MLNESLADALDADWALTVRSAPARRALLRWARVDPLLACRTDLDDVLATRRDPTIAGAVQLVLAGLAPTDEIAVRTLLQMLLPGLLALAHTVGYLDPDAADVIVALAWERLRTYPPTRRGSVAGNVILDVRKRFLRMVPRCGDPIPDEWDEPIDPGLTPEDYVLNRWLLDKLDAARRDGVISTEMLSTILRTRVGGVAVADLAVEQQVPRQKIHQRRWRAERRLRTLGLAG